MPSPESILAAGEDAESFVLMNALMMMLVTVGPGRRRQRAC